MYMIEIDDIPPSLNQFYAGKHWTWRKRICDDWHLRFKQAYRKAKLPKVISYPITLTAICYSPRIRDSDNAVIISKFAGDALVECGYLPDDSPTYISTVILKSFRGKAKTVLIIE